MCRLFAKVQYSKVSKRCAGLKISKADNSSTAETINSNRTNKQSDDLLSVLKKKAGSCEEIS